MSSILYRLACLLLAVGVGLCAQAQEAEVLDSVSSSGTAKMENVPRVPGVSSLLYGLNAGVSFSQVHDSSIGWYNVVTPALSFNLSSHYSADVSASIYPYRRVPMQNPALQASEPLQEVRGDAGDTLIGLHANFNSRVLWNTTTGSLTIPTGDRSDGLSTGRVTFDFSNHTERYVKRTGFLLDLGAGDSSGLFNSLVSRDYSTLGPLLHFQAGVVLWPYGRNYIQSVAYEQLPVGGQTVYTDFGPAQIPGPAVMVSNSSSEDNGFTTSVGIPLTTHLTLFSYYNRSLRHDLDTASVGLTYVLRGTSGPKRMSLIDRALREAETVSQTPY